MKKCELCGALARMHCESDQASLCWDCDVKVHGANFLVAKHTRTLLCHVCQNPTPWLASGHNLAPAVSVCESCIGNGNNNNKNNDNCEVISQQDEPSEADYEDDDDEEEEDDDDEEEEEEEDEEDDENQVVPWSGDSSSFSMSKPVATLDSLSSGGRGGGDGGGGGGFGLKRMKENLSFDSYDEIGCSSSHVGSGGSSNGEATSMGTSRLLKPPILCEVNQSVRNHDHDETESRTTAIIPL
ncbi:zinc finger protein CONSTANS-LIKE 4-like [Durio zibethinus]|uniref:Zinc finger protein CONSTANS-LIKE 4-like n=1 Tax=Durio zibethinus TaxID=66656 RepID=A0A6P5Y2B8_DURZI|nr:zinc finger protein CONSTANS-LIKE 4-like [Durio zibethinus]